MRFLILLFSLTSLQANAGQFEMHYTETFSNECSYPYRCYFDSGMSTIDAYNNALGEFMIECRGQGGRVNKESISDSVDCDPPRYVGEYKTRVTTCTYVAKGMCITP